MLSADRSRLDALPAPGRGGIIALAAAFLPYYCSREVCVGLMLPLLLLLPLPPSQLCCLRV